MPDAALAQCYLTTAATSSCVGGRFIVSASPSLISCSVICGGGKALACLVQHLRCATNLPVAIFVQNLHFGANLQKQ